LPANWENKKQREELEEELDKKKRVRFKVFLNLKSKIKF
jgi:hypothetical protein